MNLYAIYFSPTGGTKKVANHLASCLGETHQEIDLSCTDSNPSSLSPEALCVIAVPSFGGRVPAVAMERLASLQGQGAKAVLVTTYGNREFEDTLVELQDGAEQAGFVPVAGIASICEHSIATQFATARPNQEDMTQLAQFASAISAQLAKGEITAPPLPGNRPYKVYGGSAMKPLTDDNCIQCGLCADNCPVSAIPEEHPMETKADLCITCMRCIKFCPVHARGLAPAMLEAVGQRLQAVCAVPKENQLFLAQ